MMLLSRELSFDYAVQMTNFVVLPLCFFTGVFGYLYYFFIKFRLRSMCRGKPSRFTRHVRAICFWDLSLLTVLFVLIWPRYGLFWRKNAYLLPEGIGDRMRYVDFFWVYFIGYVTCVVRVGCQWQALVLSCERTFVIWRPLSARVITSQVSVSMLTLSVFLMTSALSMYHVLKTHSVLLVPHKEGNVTLEDIQVIIQPAGLGESIDLSVLIPFLLFHCPLPCVLLLISTKLLLAVSDPRRRLSHRKSFSRRSSLILAINNIKFLICNSAVAIVGIMEVLFGGISTDADNQMMTAWFHYRMTLHNVTNLLLAMHSASNWPLLIDYEERKKSSAMSLHLGSVKAKQMLQHIWDDLKSHSPLVSRASESSTAHGRKSTGIQSSSESKSCSRFDYEYVAK